MNSRNLLTVLAVGAFLASGWAVWRQNEQLATLRAEQAQEPTPAADPPAEPTAQETPPAAAEPSASFPVQTTSHELLQLRNRVSLLGRRQRELAGVAAEADQLRAQFARSQTNAPAGVRLPPGYMRKADARQAGYATPDDAVQSFLWALQQRDFTNVLQSLTPEVAQKLQAQVQQSGVSMEELFKGSEALPGLAIRGRESLPDGSVRLQVEVVPGLSTQTVVLRIVDGQWKLGLIPF